MSFLRKLETAHTLFWSDRSSFYHVLGIHNPVSYWRASRYLKAQGVLPYLVKGADGEYDCGPKKQVDIANLYRRIIRNCPRHVIEFGCGFSSIAMAHALKMNFEKRGKKGTLHIVEASEKWADNVEKKLSPFIDHVQIYRSTPQIQTIDGQLCHVFDRLPNVSPSMIYLDGPSAHDVQGSISGISMKGVAFECAADPLLYEWSFYSGFTMVVDGRFNNVEFLRRNLKRKYRIRTNHLNSYTVFKLVK